MLKRKTGVGALARPVLVALGLRPDGKKEVIDFRLAGAESAAQWEQFLGDLIRRGLTGERLEMLCVDGGCGLLAALPTAYPEVPVQRCWAHKIRNVLAKVRKPDQELIRAALHRIMNAPTLPMARSAARRFADRWQAIYPKAVACLRGDLDDLLTCFRYPTIEGPERAVTARRHIRVVNIVVARVLLRIASPLIAHPVLFLWGGVFVGVYTLMVAVVGSHFGDRASPHLSGACWSGGVDALPGPGARRPACRSSPRSPASPSPSMPPRPAAPDQSGSVPSWMNLAVLPWGTRPSSSRTWSQSTGI